MKVISYSLFGAGKPRNENSFDFESYLRGLAINIRMNRLLFPGWKIQLHVDYSTYLAWHLLFDKLPIETVICDDAPLTKAMLWRLHPCFNPEVTHVICRDLDSPPLYKEAQCVQYWVNSDKGAHAITDSVSHTIPMMGGMIGFRPKWFTMRTGFSSWEKMMEGQNYDWNRKGADQEFLNRVIYPCFAQPGDDSITQHYLLGMPNTFLSDWHNTVPDIEIPGVPLEMLEANDVAGHCGSAGFYNPPMFAFLRKHKDKFTDLLAIESQFGSTFFWTVDTTFK